MFKAKRPTEANSSFNKYSLLQNKLLVGDYMLITVAKYFMFTGEGAYNLVLSVSCAFLFNASTG